MKNINLKECGLVELGVKDILIIDGGGKWKKVYEWGKKLFEAIGAADACNEFLEGFKEGYNSK